MVFAGIIFERPDASPVSFVAIKNGKHDQKGYAFCSPNLNFKNLKEPIHVSKIHNLIMNIL